MNDVTALAALAASLLGTLVVSTWRVSSMAAVLLETTKQLQKNDEEIQRQLLALDAIPRIETRLNFVESNYSLVSKLANEVEVLKAKSNFVRELQRALLKKSGGALADGAEE